MAVKRWNGTAWEVYAGSDLAPVKVTDGRVGKTTFIGATTPTGMVDGDIWIDQDTATNAVVPTALLAKGDIFVATGNGAYTRLAAGNNGESLYADSTTSTGLRWQGDSNAGKNLIINGGFDIYQRSSNPTVGNTISGGNAYSIDRWNVWNTSPTGSIVLSRQLSGLTGIQYCARFQRPSGNTSGLNFFGQPIETANSILLAGKTVTVSFYARRGADYSGASNALEAQLWQNTTTDGSLQSVESGSRSNAASTTATLTTTWQRFTMTGTVASASTQLALVFYGSTSGTAGANDYYEITGVQLEQGSVATPFSRAGGTIHGELSACQRYYYKLNASQGSSYAVLGTGFATNTTTGAIVINFPVTLRVKPSAIESGGSIRIHDESNAYTVSSYTYDANTASTDNIRILVNSSGLTAYRPLFLGGNNSTAAYLAFSAEL